MYAGRVELPSRTRIAAVDSYLANAKPFAQPILTHLREAMHRAVPGVEEEMKWSRPFFVYRGVIVGNIAAFKEHCSFGLWGREMAGMLRAGGIASGEGMGSFGKIRTLADLPPTAELEGYIRHAVDLVGSGTRTKSIQRVAKVARPEATVPQALAGALRGNQAAAVKFAKLSPSCRREYIAWIAGAKREETRTKRALNAVEWIAEGKGLNWQYEKPRSDRPGDADPLRH